MKRETTQTIWRTVVFAGAMLGAPACSKKPANTTPTNTTTTTTTTTSPDSATPAADPAAAADPCQGGERPRGADPCAGGGGGTGRGFVLS